MNVQHCEGVLLIRQINMPTRARVQAERGMMEFGILNCRSNKTTSSLDVWKIQDKSPSSFDFQRQV
jgi:hypothetical protein